MRNTGAMRTGQANQHGPPYYIAPGNGGLQNRTTTGQSGMNSIQQTVGAPPPVRGITNGLQQGARAHQSTATNIANHHLSSVNSSSRGQAMPVQYNPPISSGQPLAPCHQRIAQHYQYMTPRNVVNTQLNDPYGYGGGGFSQSQQMNTYGQSQYVTENTVSQPASLPKTTEVTKGKKNMTPKESASKNKTNYIEEELDDILE